MTIVFIKVLYADDIQINISDEFDTSPTDIRLGEAVKIAVKEKVNLLNADLSGAYLSGAILSGAILRGADLIKANLTGADMTRANLTTANLTGAYTTD